MEQTEPTMPTPVADAAQNGAQRRILIIDDNVDAAGALCELLKLDGHDVFEAHGGVEGLRAALELKPDVALVDIGMPGMDGFEVVQELREHPIGMRISLIAVTGWGQDRDRERTRDAGFDAHLTKPVDPAELLSLLERLPGAQVP